MSISAINTGASALQAMQGAVNVTANNLANLATRGYTPQRATLQAQSGGGVSLSTSSAAASTDADAPSGTDFVGESVNLLVYKNAFQASAKVLRTADEMLGTLLDRRG